MNEPKLSDQEQTEMYLSYQDLIAEIDSIESKIENLKKRCLYNEELDSSLRKKIATCRFKSDSIMASIIKANELMVTKMAKSYKNVNIDEDDLFAIGKIAMIKAFKNFDPSIGKSFNDFASYCVSNAMRKEMGKEGCNETNVPKWAIEMLNKLTRVQAQMEFERCREVELEEVAYEMNLPLNILEGITKITTKNLSLDKPYSEDSSAGNAYDKLEDEHNPNPYDHTAEDFLREELPEIVSEFLTDNECGVLALHTGMKTLYAHSLDRIADEYPSVASRIKKVEKEYLASKGDDEIIESLEDFFQLRSKAALRPIPAILKSLGL